MMKALLIMSILVAGCSIDELKTEPQCAHNRDCNDGSVCQDGRCLAIAIDSGSDAADRMDAGESVLDGGSDASVVDCADQYDIAPGYLFCRENADFCEFRASTRSGGSCESVCQEHHGECLEAFSNGDELCVGLSVQSCGFDSASDMVCRCSRGCGGAAPCQDGQSCTVGMCRSD